ncbi:hypothetical protein NE237_010162 [Protea cynaroides]|uniref:Uncharacterized protein n=1 Tax=Protea cynaroides TaxID=273540 RepID=A0A9Q0KZ51_9MAGN|nr:hypothetical protein NE237_010162 [Protea cynaroides]
MRPPIASTNPSLAGALIGPFDNPDPNPSPLFIDLVPLASHGPLQRSNGDVDEHLVDSHPSLNLSSLASVPNFANAVGRGTMVTVPLKKREKKWHGLLRRFPIHLPDFPH